MQINTEATEFPELNALLVELTSRTKKILGDNFVGAYLQGSFAIGDADMSSDCDFLIPVRHSPSALQEAELRHLHAEIPTRKQHWAINLEGSYPVADELRTLEGMGAQWLYIDRGWSDMQWSTHCNTEVARWSLREHGVVLTGPEPKDLVEPVPAQALRTRMAHQLPTAVSGILDWASPDIAWTQRYIVATVSRMLYTLITGEVVSKKAAMEWAARELDPHWRPLLSQVLADRTHPWDPDEKPRPGSLAKALAFAADVVSQAAQYPHPA